jgi:hypothetical protein
MKTGTKTETHLKYRKKNESLIFALQLTQSFSITRKMSPPVRKGSINS